MDRVFADNDPVADAELAAAIVAVELYLAAEVQDRVLDEENPISGWRASAKLVAQGVEPTKLRTMPRWNRIERIRRNTHGFEGVIGL
jgi:hypothetical protein